MIPASKSSPEPQRGGSGLPPKWVPVAIVALGSAWAAHYVWHTNANSYGDQPTVMFMNMLIWPLLLSALAVVYSSLRGKYEEQEVGLSDHRRLILIFAVPIYGLLIAFGGFILASLAFLLVLLPILGVRNPLVLLLVCGVVLCIIWLGFFHLMSVPLPLWPRGMNL